MPVISGATDKITVAHSIFCELKACGFRSSQLNLTLNPDNPDGIPGVSVVDELWHMPGILHRVFRNTFNIGHVDPTASMVRTGGIVMRIRVTCRDEEEITNKAFCRHHVVTLPRC